MSVCRVCLCSEPRIDIIELNDGDRKPNYQDIMEFCLDVEIAEDSTITTKLCTKCHEKIIEFYQFKLLALKSDAHLRCLISKNVIYENYLKDNLHVPENNFIAETLTDIDLQGIDEIVHDEIITKEEDDLCSNDNEELRFDIDVKVESSTEIQPDDTSVSVSSITNENVEDLENETLTDIDLQGIDEIVHDEIITKEEDDLCSNDNEEVVERVSSTEIQPDDTPVSVSSITNENVEDLENETLTDIDLQGIDEIVHDEIITKEEDDLSSNDNEEVVGRVSSTEIQPDDTPVSVSSITNENVEDLKNELTSTKKVHSEIYNIKKMGVKKQYRKKNSSQICPQCGKLVKDLDQHLETHSSYEQRRKFKCDLCPKIFQTIHGKYRHASTHSINAKKQCSICNIEVLHLKSHMKNIHQPEARRFHCVICDKKYITQLLLDDHVSVHMNDKNFQCDECGHSCRTNFLLNKHKRRIHLKEKGFQCDYCSKCFFIKHRLIMHMRVHTNEKPYPCPKCEMKFISTGSLKKHQYIHSGLKFDCTKCDMTFSNPTYLKAHLKTHLKVKDHPCRYCQKAYYRSDHRNRHEHTAHLEPKTRKQRQKKSAATKTKAQVHLKQRK